ncbi:7-cyano-7-deazaguanine synthase QueC [Rubrobacter calidifluminis]|uniref:7-cyano-7-deazaguanine synthase QueC n=1 Tax=Rubrobacter calidifluminis TaxID=1392640 RepID=UPI00235F6F4B|nr:7-cyano-7-deazaguanine synthase QueC [Rubrobacter calidifluminis]
MEREEALAVVSGGLDSVTLAHLLAEEGYSLHLLSFDYGQRHGKELEYARRCAERLGASFDVVDLSGVGRLLSGSALTDEIEVPHGRYDEESMSVTVVPNRNAIFLSVAYGAAVARGSVLVAAAMHAGDHPVYPDCRPEFVRSFEAMERLAVEGLGHPGLRLYTPFIHKTKAEIVGLGASLGVPFEETWSCYEGGELHCGLCGTCTERREAFELAGVEDPTEYRG